MRVDPGLILWGLSPTLLFATFGARFASLNVHPESPDFPSRELDLMFLSAMAILFGWSLRMTWGRFDSVLARILVAIPVTMAAVFVNLFLAASGCALVIGGSDLGLW